MLLRELHSQSLFPLPLIIQPAPLLMWGSHASVRKQHEETRENMNAKPQRNCRHHQDQVQALKLDVSKLC